MSVKNSIYNGTKWFAYSRIFCKICALNPYNCLTQFTDLSRLIPLSLVYDLCLLNYMYIKLNRCFILQWLLLHACALACYLASFASTAENV